MERKIYKEQNFRLWSARVCVCVCVETDSRQAEEREQCCRVMTLLRLSVWKRLKFKCSNYSIYKSARWRDLMFFLIYIFKQHKYRHFLNFSTRAFNYYKLKCGECLCISHELRVKIVNFDINYLCIGTIEKSEINLAYK